MKTWIKNKLTQLGIYLAREYIDGLKKQVSVAAIATNKGAEHVTYIERAQVIQNDRTTRMITQLVTHLRERGDPQSLAALKAFNDDAKAYNPIGSQLIAPEPSKEPASKRTNKKLSP